MVNKYICNVDENADLESPEYYFNRELSFLEFNRRVINEAKNPEMPLLERLKFCAILSSNLDEFFMIRVAGLKGQIADGLNELSINGMTPREQLKEIHHELLSLHKTQEHILLKDVFPGLQKHGIYINRYSELDKESQKKVKDYFKNAITPALTPLALSAANPFPRLINKSLNVAFVLSDPEKKNPSKQFAFVQIPSILPRFIKMDWLPGNRYILIEQLVKEFGHLLFPGMDILHTNTFRITRDADIEIAEDEADDLISAIAGELKKRSWGRAAVRLERSSNMPKFLSNYLQTMLDIDDDDVYIVNRPLSLPDFFQLTALDFPQLKEKPFVPEVFKPFSRNGSTVFSAIKNNDFLLHHPFDSFDSSVVKFIDEASKDEDVVAIKITLYRTNNNSDIVKALIRAALNNKSVVALVELKARFDEEKNIEWAKELEKAGVHVVYGVPGLKTHSKICSVVRRENKKLKTYVHLATGNYNQNTAKIYTDVGFFTSNPDFGKDAVALFNNLTAYSHYNDWRKLIPAPDFLCKRTIKMIEREAALHTKENPGLIICKMNSLAHGNIIRALYRASQKGVNIKLIIRGICCLRPGIKGLSENIEVRSVVGRFLEHTRIFYFKNAGADEVYLSSADWMSRNMLRRVEIQFPIESEKLKTWLIEWLNIYWKDNCKSWVLQSDGSYKQRKPSEDEERFSAQEYFLKQIKK